MQRAFDIVSMNVEKATNRCLRSFATRQRSHHHAEPGLRGGTQDPVTFPRPRSTGFCFARSDDRDGKRWRMGCARPSRSMDSREDRARNCDVRKCCHADALPEAATGRIAVAGMLCRQRFGPAQGAHPAGMSLRFFGAPCRLAESPRGCHPRSTSDHQSSASPAFSPGRSSSAACRRVAAGGSIRCEAAQADCADKRRKPEDDRASFCRRDRNDFWQMAATVAADAGDAPAWRRRQGDARGARGRLQHIKCIHCRLSKNARVNTNAILPGPFNQLRPPFNQSCRRL